jgi:uncharacterized lipoprotein YbaY
MRPAEGLRLPRITIEFTNEMPGEQRAKVISGVAARHRHAHPPDGDLGVILEDNPPCCLDVFREAMSA